MKPITNALRSLQKSFSLLLLILACGTLTNAQLKSLNKEGEEEKAPVCKRFISQKRAATAILNIFGYNQVQAGHTYTFWVQPSDPNNPGNPYTPIWNDEGYLDNKGSVSSTWSDPVNGKEWCTVYFSTPGWCWLTYYGPYNGYMDWGELSIEVLP
jgi:hypothetical protein